MTDERPPGLEKVESEPKTQGEEQSQGGEQAGGGRKRKWKSARGREESAGGT